MEGNVIPDWSLLIKFNFTACSNAIVISYAKVSYNDDWFKAYEKQQFVEIFKSLTRFAISFTYNPFKG